MKDTKDWKEKYIGENYGKLIVEGNLENLWQRDDGSYWIQHLEETDEGDFFDGGGCSIDKATIDSLLKEAREEALHEKCPRCGKEWIIHDCPELSDTTASKSKLKKSDK